MRVNLIMEDQLRPDGRRIMPGALRVKPGTVVPVAIYGSLERMVGEATDFRRDPRTKIISADIVITANYNVNLDDYDKTLYANELDLRNEVADGRTELRIFAGTIRSVVLIPR